MSKLSLLHNIVFIRENCYNIYYSDVLDWQAQVGGFILVNTNILPGTTSE